MRDEGGKSKGFGFVCYKNWQDAITAVKALNKKGGLHVGEALTFEERKEEKEK